MRMSRLMPTHTRYSHRHAMRIKNNRTEQGRLTIQAIALLVGCMWFLRTKPAAGVVENERQSKACDTGDKIRFSLDGVSCDIVRFEADNPRCVLPANETDLLTVDFGISGISGGGFNHNN